VSSRVRTSHQWKFPAEDLLRLPQQPPPGGDAHGSDLGQLDCDLHRRVAASDHDHAGTGVRSRYSAECSTVPVSESRWGSAGRYGRLNPLRERGSGSAASDPPTARELRKRANGCGGTRTADSRRVMSGSWRGAEPCRWQVLATYARPADGVAGATGFDDSRGELPPVPFIRSPRVARAGVLQPAGRGGAGVVEAAPCPLPAPHRCRR
jgi:hypothetical protein